MTTNFKCPECKSENILLSYSDVCIVVWNQKENEESRVEPTLELDWENPSSGECLDCENEWDF